MPWQGRQPCAVLVSLWVMQSPSLHAVRRRGQSHGYQCLGVGLLVTESHSATEELLFLHSRESK